MCQLYRIQEWSHANVIKSFGRKWNRFRTQNSGKMLTLFFKFGLFSLRLLMEIEQFTCTKYSPKYFNNFNCIPMCLQAIPSLHLAFFFSYVLLLFVYFELRCFFFCTNYLHNVVELTFVRSAQTHFAFKRRIKKEKHFTAQIGIFIAFEHFYFFVCVWYNYQLGINKLLCLKWTVISCQKVDFRSKMFLCLFLCVSDFDIKLTIQLLTWHVWYDNVWKCLYGISNEIWLGFG